MRKRHLLARSSSNDVRMRHFYGEVENSALGSYLFSQALWSEVWHESKEGVDGAQERLHVELGVEQHYVCHQAGRRADGESVCGARSHEGLYTQTILCNDLVKIRNVEAMLHTYTYHASH